jgi:hypothetical protein
MPKKNNPTADTRRYSARLLFQFRVVVDGDAGKKRLCEERIITFTAVGARAALREAKRRGRAARYSYKNSQGSPVYFEFVGVLELLCLDPECDADEVWYHIVERLTPMERRATLIPPEHQLNAIRFDL